MHETIAEAIRCFESYPAIRNHRKANRHPHAIINNATGKHELVHGRRARWEASWRKKTEYPDGAASRKLLWRKEATQVARSGRHHRPHSPIRSVHRRVVTVLAWVAASVDDRGRPRLNSPALNLPTPTRKTETLHPEPRRIKWPTVSRIVASVIQPRPSHQDGRHAGHPLRRELTPQKGGSS